MKTVHSEETVWETTVSEHESKTPARHLFACHCGRVRAELLTPIEDQELKEDNCSSCVRVSGAGAVLLFHHKGGGFAANVHRQDTLAHTQPKTKCESTVARMHSSTLPDASLAALCIANPAAFMCSATYMGRRLVFSIGCLPSERKMLSGCITRTCGSSH
jgi:hypothetical protein